MGEFDRTKDCFKCHRYIDEDKVRLKRIVVGPDTYRRPDIECLKFEKYCTDCVIGNTVVHDVWYGYGSGTHIEENICDPDTGKPIPFSSKNEKWAAMQKAKVAEVGDRVHGARTNFTK